MKRLFVIGSGIFINSIIPILSWVCLSLVLGDSRISNIFSITYSIQFIYQILRCFFGAGANIRKEKERDNNAVENSNFWGIIVSSIIFLIILFLVDEYIIFFGQDVDFYKPYVVYSILLFFLQTLMSFLIEKMYFEDKEKLANIYLLVFNIMAFVLLIVLSLIIPNSIVALILILSVLTIFVIALYVKYFKKFKIKLDFYKNFKYDSANILSALLMFIIYLFGFKTVFTSGEEYLIAINIAALCTDTQWDMLDAINIVAKVDISKNRYEYKKQVCSSYIYAFVLIISSMLMSILLSLTQEVVVRLIVIYMAFQLVDMLFYPLKSILSTYTQLEYSPLINTVCSFSLKGIRTILSVFIISPYCVDLSQLISGLMGFVIYLIIRFVKYKVVDEKLTLKTLDFNKEDKKSLKVFNFKE